MSCPQHTRNWFACLQTRYLLSEEAAAAAQVQTQSATKEVKSPQQVGPTFQIAVSSSLEVMQKHIQAEWMPGHSSVEPSGWNLLLPLHGHGRARAFALTWVWQWLRQPSVLLAGILPTIFWQVHAVLCADCPDSRRSSARLRCCRRIAILWCYSIGPGNSIQRSWPFWCSKLYHCCFVNTVSRMYVRLPCQ